MRIRNIFYVLFIIGLILLLTGCSNNKEDIKVEKGISEVIFLQNQCSTIIEKYIFDEYDSSNQIDWDILKEDYYVLNSSIDVILIDLASLQVSSKSIVELQKRFSDLNYYYINKDIYGFMKQLCETYSFITDNLMNSLIKEDTTIQEKRAKSNLLYVGYYLKLNDKNNSLNSIIYFDENYNILNKDKNYLENNSYKYNKIFINIERLKLQIDNNNYDNCKEILKEILKYFM